MICGAPQGSKIRSFLCKVMYHDFLEIFLPGNTFIVGFADNAIIVSTVDIAEELKIIVIDRYWLNQKCLHIAIKRIEALLITDRQPYNPPQI